MQNYKYGLLGFGTAAVVGVGALVWQQAAKDLGVSEEAPKASVAAPAETKADKPAAPETKPEPSAPQAATPPATAQPEAPKTDAPAVAQETQIVPSFDLLRAEGDGSVVVAGKAAPNSTVEVISGSRVLGTTKAEANGDFVVVLNEPLKPGDHQLVLRATGTDGKAASSAQTAIVSIPEKEKGQVLALVEEPGQASRLITRPETPEVTPPDAQAGKTPSLPAQLPDAPVAIEAVEIEGSTVFVAGKASNGDRVVVHANDILLGSAAVSTEGRFLVQSQKNLSEGDYVIRAELMDKANRVIATARVPFHREAGQNQSAVAQEIKGDASSNVPATQQDAQAPLENVDGSVIIRRGDNLWTIAKRTYGRGTRYTTIYLANRDQIRNPDLILPGQVFTMPKEALAEDEAKRKLQSN